MSRHSFAVASLCAAAAAVTPPWSIARADEGMWTFNNAPKKQVAAAYGFEMTDPWLEHVQRSAARITGSTGCSASFVSEHGLVMTNHHCAHSCIQQLSTPARNYVETGFYARAEGDEVKCPEIEIDALQSISDVTARVEKATAGLAGQRYGEAQKGELARIEKECVAADPRGPDRVRCDVVTLYHGGEYDLYKYDRYQDVRLVFAPEFRIAFFGGDPDNFNFPRYDLDVSFLRVWDGGKPAVMKDYLRFSRGGAKDGQLTFVAGHPGATDRQLTVAELAYQRDVALPQRLLRLAEMRGLLTEFQKRGPEEKRVSEHDLFGVENAYKALRGRFETLLDAAVFAAKVADEKTLRDAVSRDPAAEARVGGAWGAIEAALVRLRELRKPLYYIEQGGGFSSDLAGIAKTLVRAPVERAKPNEKRLREFRESALPELTQRLFSTAPISPPLEILKLGFSLTKLREELGADDPFVKEVLGSDSPEALATRLVTQTKLADVATRKALWAGGEAAIAASQDPMIRLLAKIDPEARAVRKKVEEDVDSVLKKNDELVAKARFAQAGRSTYPDATFTLRLSYGQVKGYAENGRAVKPITTVGGAFARATGQDPFKLPDSWIAARPKLDPSTAMNIATTNDIIGGNSGSPVFDRAAEVVGLIFDGNIESLGGEYWYDASVNRAVAVASQALVEALGKVYGADRIVRELLPPSPGGAKGRGGKAR